MAGKSLNRVTLSGNLGKDPEVKFTPSGTPVAKIALDAPRNGYVNVAGPERRRLDELTRELLKAKNDPRQVATDPSLGYFGGQVPENALVPDHDEVLGTLRFSDWLAHSQAAAPQTR